MLQGLYNSVAGALVQKARMAVTANNIANANTTGFKKDVSVFHHRLSEALENPELRHKSNMKLTPLGGGIYMAEAWTDHRQEGPIEQTGSETHLAVRGPGYFRVTNSDQTAVRYTRDGNFHLDAEGYLVSEDGLWHLTDSRGNKIFAGAEGRVSFDGNRDIRINGEVAGKVQLVDFADEDLKSLKKIGDNQYEAANGIEERDFTGNILVGYLEASAVSHAEEMVEMIQTQRGYDINMKMITMQDQTIERAISQVASVPS